MSQQDIKKVLTAVDRSTKGLSTTADAFVKTVADLTGQVAALTGQQSTLALDIEFKTNELDGLDAQLLVKQREHAAELALRVKENEDAVLESLLKARGLVTKTPAELNALQAQLAEALEDNQDAIDGAVKDVTASLKASAAIELSRVKSDHAVEIAQYKANAGNSTTQITFLTAQNTKLEAQIEADRDARIEIAKAEAARQAVTVNTNGK